MIELTKAVVFITPTTDDWNRKVAQVFCDVLWEKSGLRLAQSAQRGACCVEFYHEEQELEPEVLALFATVRRPGAEGFRIRIVEGEDGAVRVVVLGRDARGEFYGIARLLRKVEAAQGRLALPRALDGFSASPQYPLRGHQLGYRDKNNTYSAWGTKDFAAYIRDLALFGANAIELLPPKTDDALYSATFPEDPFAVMENVAKVIHSYRMQVWLWYPNVGRDYTDWACIDEELKEREKVFAAIPYLDAILVPLGDPGSLWPAQAFRLTEQFVKIMHKYHPQAKVWVAPQHFQPEPGWYDEFYAEIAKEPDWVDGVCFAPWEQHPIEEMAEKLPPKYRENIRNYPDISHNSNCQFPVPEWDMAFALTSGREGYNARPVQMKQIHNKIEPYTMGTITYSEGIHDDVNKIVWADQDFDSRIEVRETLEDYARLFISSPLAERLASLLLKTEKNWDGPVLENAGIDEAYEALQEMEREADEAVQGNYRYQMLKLRVLTDYWTKYKYKQDQALEKEARAAIDEAGRIGSAAAIAKARAILHLSQDRPTAEDVLFEMEKLADALKKSCGIQLTETRHRGQRWIRGAYLDTRAMPLNDYQYLMQSFKRIEKMGREEQRQAALQKLNLRIHPGEGNLYFNLGSREGFSHVTRQKSWLEDPGFLQTPFVDHSIYSMMGLFHDMDGWYYEFPMPLAWALNATALYGTPLEVTLPGLDPQAAYTMKVFYPNSFLKAVHLMTKPEDETLVHFTAGGVELADRIPQIEIGAEAGWEYELPRETYADGTLRLRWEVYGTLKAFAVSEIWLFQK